MIRTAFSPLSVEWLPADLQVLDEIWNVPKDCMTVDEYIGKIGKGLDMRYNR